jgi:hypothetical protein
MRDTNESEDWRVLCELASKEKDPEKLIDLVVKINRIIRGRPFWSRLSSFVMITYERSTLYER